MIIVTSPSRPRASRVRGGRAPAGHFPVRFRGPFLLLGIFSAIGKLLGNLFSFWQCAIFSAIWYLFGNLVSFRQSGGPLFLFGEEVRPLFGAI